MAGVQEKAIWFGRPAVAASQSISPPAIYVQIAEGFPASYLGGDMYGRRRGRTPAIFSNEGDEHEEPIAHGE